MGWGKKTNWKSAIGNWQCLMSCEEIQQSLSLYVDDGLTADARVACYRHLEVCPVCRAGLAEMRSIRSGLAMLSRPAPPVDLIPSINQALIVAAAMQKARHKTTVGDVAMVREVVEPLHRVPPRWVELVVAHGSTAGSPA